MGNKKAWNSQIYSTRKHTSAETADGSRGYFRKVDWAHDTSLPDTNTSNKATSIGGIQAAVVSDKDGNTEDPENAELASSPNTADTITNDESTGPRLAMAFWVGKRTLRSTARLTAERRRRCQAEP